MTASKDNQGQQSWHKDLVQRRRHSPTDHLRPQRWNWDALVRPLDDSISRQAEAGLPGAGLPSLRHFWLDGLFASISDNFYLGYLALFALAYGASGSQVGLMEAVANMLGVLALFPGARLVERTGRAKAVVLWSGGGLMRLALLGLAAVPLLGLAPRTAILAIILFNGLRAFAGSLGNPAWTAIVADLVPESMRGRFFANRNMAMGLAALLVAPLAGRLVDLTNRRLGTPYAGYQVILVLAFLAGMGATFFFSRIREGGSARAATRPYQRGDLRRALARSPGFTGLVVSALVWNVSLQVAAPFFNVYLVSAFQASTLTVGLLAGIASLTALFGQRAFGRLLDRKGAFWVQTVTGLLIPLAPLAWALINAPWQVGFINVFAGFLWAGYNLASFNLLLKLTPDEQRPRATALYQTAVFGAAVIGPLLGGFLADAVGYRFVFGLSFAGRLVGTILFIWLTLVPARRAQVTA